jgi:hypothetical protein
VAVALDATHPTRDTAGRPASRGFVHSGPL